MSEFSDRIMHELEEWSSYDRLLLDQLRELLGEVADEQKTRWLHEVVDKLCDGLQHEFAREDEGGYLGEVLERFPTWEPRVSKLREDHERLLQDLSELREQLDRPAGANRVSAELRTQFEDWIERLTAHKQRENELLLDAMNLDIGEGD